MLAVIHYNNMHSFEPRFLVHFTLPLTVHQLLSIDHVYFLKLCNRSATLGGGAPPKFIAYCGCGTAAAEAADIGWFPRSFMLRWWGKVGINLGSQGKGASLK